MQNVKLQREYDKCDENAHLLQKIPRITSYCYSVTCYVTFHNATDSVLWFTQLHIQDMDN